MAAPCTAEDATAYYSLAPLQADQDYVVKSPWSLHEFNLNVCQAVKTQLWNVDDVEEDKVGAYYRGKTGDFALGSVNNTVTVVDGNPVVWLTEGSPCPGRDEFRASTAIRFVCDSAVKDGGSPQLIAQFPPSDEEACTFFFEWRTHAACPTSQKSLGVGHAILVFSSVLFIAIFVYFLALTLYNRFFLGLRGLDQFPRLVPSCPTSVTDCFGWLHDKITGRGDGFVGGPRLSGWSSRANRNGFQRIPEEEQGIMGAGGTRDARFSLDDDDDDEEARVAVGNGHSPHYSNDWATRDGVGSDGVIRL